MPRRYPELPVVGVGAIVLSHDLQRVLLIRRGAEPARGLWSFPGGVVDAGEGLCAACARELAEETGLTADDVTLRDVGHVVERIIPDEHGAVEYHFVILDFWGVAGPEVEVAACSDASEAEWVDIARLDGRQTTRGVPVAVQRALQRARGRPVSGPLLEPHSA